MGPLRKTLSVRLEEGVHARLRRQSLRSGVPTSALVRALVHRWLDEQDEAGEATTELPEPERERQPGLFGEEGGLLGSHAYLARPQIPSCLLIYPS